MNEVNEWTYVLLNAIAQSYSIDMNITRWVLVWTNSEILIGIRVIFQLDITRWVLVWTNSEILIGIRVILNIVLFVVRKNNSGSYIIRLELE